MSSPGYPEPYLNGTDCVWIINATETKEKVHVAFSDINITETDCRNNHIEVRIMSLCSLRLFSLCVRLCHLIVVEHCYRLLCFIYTANSLSLSIKTFSLCLSLAVLFTVCLFVCLYTSCSMAAVKCCPLELS